MEKLVITTEWFDNFICPGGDCGLTCCSEDWKIALTDDEIDKYKEIDTEFKSKLIEALDFENNTFKCNDGKCCLLNDKGYCEIVLNLGEEYLSKTCSLFPRERKDYGFMEEWSVEILCPLVAEKLLDAKSLEFGYREVEVGDIQMDSVETSYIMDLFGLRTSLIENVQKYPGKYIHGKALIIANTYEYIKERLNDGKFDHSNVMHFSSSNLSEEAIEKAYFVCEKYAEMKDEKAKFWMTIFNDLDSGGVVECVFKFLRRNYSFVEEKIQTWKENPLEYKKCFEKYSEFIRDNCTRYEENFFVYSLFFNWIESSQEEFGLKLGGRFIELILFHLCGMALLDYSEFSRKDFSIMIAAIDRMFSHSDVLRECGKRFLDLMKREPISIMLSLV